MKCEPRVEEGEDLGLVVGTHSLSAAYPLLREEEKGEDKGGVSMALWVSSGVVRRRAFIAQSMLYVFIDTHW